MNTVAGIPTIRAASATPWAWLPALAATTPRARSASPSRAMRVYAPRILNEPVRWRFSHFSQHRPTAPRREVAGARDRRLRDDPGEERAGGLHVGETNGMGGGGHHGIVPASSQEFPGTVSIRRVTSAA